MMNQKIQSVLHQKAKDLRQYEEKRENELYQRTDIRLFLEKHGLDRHYLHQHFAIFHRYVLSLHTPRPYVLAYADGETYLEIPKKVESLEEQQQKNILYSDLPAHNKPLYLRDLQLDDHMKILIILLNKVLAGEDKQGYYIYGDFGVGKTYLCRALMQEFIGQGKTVAFTKVNNFLSEARRLVIQDAELLNRYLQALKEADVLFLDDIGNEGVSSFGRDDILFMVLDYRMERQLLTFFTSNQDLRSLRHHYAFDKQQKEEKLKSDRLLERILTLAKPYCLKGENKRHS